MNNNCSLKRFLSDAKDVLITINGYCVSTKWIRWAKRRMSRDTRRKQGRLVADYWCYMADGSVVCPQCGNRIDGLNWYVGPRCKACGSENIIVERMDRNDTARTHKTEY